MEAKYPNLVFSISNGVITVLGGKIGVPAWTVKNDTWAVRGDSLFHPSIRAPPTQIEKPVSSWPFPGASASSAQIPRPSVAKTDVENKPSVSVASEMPPKRNRFRRKKGRPTKRSTHFRINNAALRPTRRPFKQVFEIKLSAGYFDLQLSIATLVPELLTTFEEIRITNLTAVFITKDMSVTAGIYTAILLDQSGYGLALKSTSTWFKRVSDMPGSVIRHATRGFKLNWKATEPDSRNYVKVIDTADLAKAIARIYFIGQDSTLAMQGVLLVLGHCLCRGQYYDASKLTVQMINKLRLDEIEMESCSSGEFIDE